MFNKFKASLIKWHDFIDISFIPDEIKKSYHNLLREQEAKIYTDWY